MCILLQTFILKTYHYLKQKKCHSILRRLKPSGRVSYLGVKTIILFMVGYNTISFILGKLWQTHQHAKLVAKIYFYHSLSDWSDDVSNVSSPAGICQEVTDKITDVHSCAALEARHRDASVSSESAKLGKNRRSGVPCE